MRRKSVIITLFLIFGIAVIAGVNFNRPTGKVPNEEQASRNLQVRNIQQENSHIQKIDMLHLNNHIKMKLNNSPSIKMIHHNEQDKSHYYDKEAVVNFKDPPSQADVDKMAREIDGKLIDKLDSVYIFKSNSQTTTELIQYFDQNNQVAFVEPHYIFLQNEVNDTLYRNYQWNLPAVGTERGWNFTRGSDDVTIAVVDTGVDLNHPDLSGRLAKGYNVLAKNDNPNDDNGHGTHVAGIIAAVTNNAEGVAGVTWYNPVMPVKVMNAEGIGGSFDVAEGIRWAADHGADIINLSLGNYQSSQVLEDAIRYALDKDIVVVAAAGNDNTSQPSFPAALPGVISVAAVDWEGKRAPFSNYGDHIDIAAPGVYIPSTFTDGQYASLSGTSMAAPHVSALAGLIRSVNPNMKNTEVVEMMTKTTQKAGTEVPDIYYGNGIIDNSEALQLTYKRTKPFGGWFNRFNGR
ncbi:S8 family peptidase [Siminovitchia fortis]|uniref:S8 family peptidase n=1 Tax=Siminovitchia fortis TaxID=254758 RepID=UPI0011A77CE1|nr:S8 family peptidase [Siminovitchia fortis]